MKKRILCVILLLCFLFSAVACGDKTEDTEEDGLSMKELFHDMLSLNKIKTGDKLIGYFGDCPIYLSFVLNEGESLSGNNRNVVDESGSVVTSLYERTTVLAYSMAAYVLNYLNDIPSDNAFLSSYDIYQTDFLHAAGFPNSGDTEAVDAFVSDDAAYEYLESFISSAADLLLETSGGDRDKAVEFIYQQLIGDGTLNEDRTFTESGLANYKKSVLIASEYNFLEKNEYTAKIETLLEGYYVFGGIQ